MARVVLENLTKTYPATGKQPAFAAVKGIDLTIESGEFMVLVGPSGCGKSTTLRMIAGLEEISEGSISIDGRIVNGVLPKDRDIAMVFQSYALYPHMSVFENMAFGLRLRKISAAEIDRRVRETAALLGLESLLDRHPKALSGGQRQRVALGRAIVRQPKVFLFDEPLSNLDAKMRVAMRAEISKLHARLGATMIYVTHDQTEAMTMGDRICVMNEGRIEQVAAPLDLYRAPRTLFAAGFIGSPPMNFFRGSLQAREGRIWFVEEHATAGRQVAVPLADEIAARAAPRAGSCAVLGIRPEGLRLSPAGSIGATVEMLEPLGAETLVHLTTGTTGFVMRVDPTAAILVGEKVHVEISTAQSHVFDGETGRAV